VRLGRVSMDSARHDYGTVIDRDSMKILEGETDQEKKKLRHSRPPLRIIDRGERFRDLLAKERITLTSEDPVL